MNLDHIIPGLATAYAAVGDEVTFTRQKSVSGPAIAPWSTHALFEWDKSVFRNGSYHNALVINVAADASFIPQEGDLVSAAGRANPWKVKHVKPHAMGVNPFGYEIELGT